MSEPLDSTTVALQRGAAPGRGLEIAQHISRILHPMILGVMSFFLVGLFGTGQPVFGLLWALLGIALLIIPPTFFFIWRLRQGAYTDEDVSNRRQRHELYAFSALTLVVGLLVLSLLKAPIIFIELLICAMAMTIAAALINLFWKISVHALSISSFATLATILWLPLGLLSWIGVMAVAWARIRTRNHTPLQVLAGAALSVIVIWTVFSIFGWV
ncbi:MAG: PAP2 family protein [Chloroflexaceae bacterium]|nr:PAP2 family protein [Chloroflexaceae bacterium]NJO07118.1 PAP2 family protein [Chloroflexaceae bacterium]